MKQYQNRQSKKKFGRPKRRKKISFDFSFLRHFFNLRFLASLLCLTAVCALGYFALFSGYFTIKDVTISGNESIPTGEIETTARNAISGQIYGYLPADNLWLINERALTDIVMSAHPEIDNLVISKKFPAQLDFSMTEKQPALIWCRSDCYFVNDQGVAYMETSEEDLENQKKHFLKIIEESPIVEEVDEGGPETSVDEDLDGEGEEISPETGEASIEDATIDTENESEDAGEVSLASGNSSLPAIEAGNQVSDENFIRFALDVNANVMQDGKLTIKYYKTKGYKTRELIAYTDKNIRLYFDATQDAGKQTDNLGNFIEKGIEDNNVSSLKYIYLKNIDRVFYK